MNTNRTLVYYTGIFQALRYNFSSFTFLEKKQKNYLFFVTYTKELISSDQDKEKNDLI